jgi:hypothetical protein
MTGFMFDSSILAMSYTVINHAAPGADCDTMTRGKNSPQKAARTPIDLK